MQPRLYFKGSKKKAETYLESSWTSTMEPKSSIVDVWLGSKHLSKNPRYECFPFSFFTICFYEVFGEQISYPKLSDEEKVTNKYFEAYFLDNSPSLPKWFSSFPRSASFPPFKMIFLEAAVRRCSSKFRNIGKKTPVLEPFQ